MVAGAIDRPIDDDELKIFFDTREPVPLPIIAAFLLAVHHATEYDLGDGYFLELVDYGKGSEEFRFRAIRQMMRSPHGRNEAEEKQQRIKKIGTATRLVRNELGAGLLAVRAKDILREASGSVLTIQAGFETRPVIYDQAQLIEGAQRYEALKEARSQPMLEVQRYLRQVIDEGERLELVGKVMPRKPQFFRTAKGTKLPIAACPPDLKKGELVAIFAEVVAMRDEDDLGIVIREYQYKDDR
jgi:hypothetical protein